MKNILLCTDCSENAKQAIDQCLFLFKDQAVNYKLLYTYFVSDTSITDLISYNDAVKSEVKACLHSESNRIKNLPFMNPNVSITTQTVFGKTENVVQRFINKNKVDLVVIGNQGHNYSPQRLFGSTTEKLLYEIKRPKLIVPSQVQKNDEKKELLIVQESEMENYEWWSTLTAFSNNKNSSFKMIILPSDDKKISSFTIPPQIEKQLSSIVNYTNSYSTEINEKLVQIVEEETPHLMHLNIRDKQLALQLLNERLPAKSICNKTPFIIQPFG